MTKYNDEERAENFQYVCHFSILDNYNINLEFDKEVIVTIKDNAFRPLLRVTYKKILTRHD